MTRHLLLQDTAGVGPLQSASIVWNFGFADVSNYSVVGVSLAVFAALVFIIVGRLVCWCVQGRVGPPVNVAMLLYQLYDIVTAR